MILCSAFSRRFLFYGVDFTTTALKKLQFKTWFHTCLRLKDPALARSGTKANESGIAIIISTGVVRWLIKTRQTIRGTKNIQ